MGAGHSHEGTPVAFQLQLSFNDEKDNVINLSEPHFIVPGNKEKTLTTLIKFLAEMKRLGGAQNVSRIRAHIFVPAEISDSLAKKIDETVEAMSQISFITKLQELKLYELGQQNKILYTHINMFNLKHREKLKSMISNLLTLADYVAKHNSASSITAYD